MRPAIREGLGSQGVPLQWPQRLALGVYSLVLRLARPLLRRKLARRARTEPGYAHALDERLGRYASPLPLGWADPSVLRVWVHAVSLGETRAAAVWLPLLRERLPGVRILLTHSTATGWTEGQRHVRPGDVQTWLPWDEPGVVRDFVRHFRPSAGVLMETEVWPNLVRVCAQQGMPLVLANARLNERSHRQARRLAWLSGPAYAGLRAVWAQTEADAHRLRSLGAPVQAVWGNLKFDAQPDEAQCATGRRWRKLLQRPVVMLASSREGEEAEFFEKILALSLIQQANSASVFNVSSVVWLVVPRHPQRFDTVAEMVRSRGWACQRRSTWPDGDAGVQALARHGQGIGPGHGPTVVLGDSLGEMALYYSLSDVALLGGSFAPLGGQNLIEALACACPVVLGPHTFNFAEVSEQAVASGAAVRALTLGDALQVALAWVGMAHVESTSGGPAGPADRARAAKAAASLVASGQGASDRTARAVARLLQA